MCALPHEHHVDRTFQVLTDNVNLMAMNLTNQVRSIAEVTKAVAGGDLTKKVEVDVRGEMLDLKETVNGMTGSLSIFADEVTRVAREVGTEGRLGGQAKVTNVGGTWKVRLFYIEHKFFFRLKWFSFLISGLD
jgi:osomolarity two-component system sensor histidine kinase NIK1